MRTVLWLLLLSGCDGSTDVDAGESDAPSSEDAPATDAPRADAGPTDLPRGDEGIAARHPGDEGIAGDPAVIFHDDFERYADASELGAQWDAVYHDVRITRNAADVHRGLQSLEMVNPLTTDEVSTGVAHTLDSELDVLFLRFYSRFDGSFDVVGSSHNGGGISAHYFVDGMATPGIPADGTNKFLIEFECWRGEASEPNPGNLNVYIYHPEQRSMWGDHFFPDGTVLPNTSLAGDFGSAFVARPNRVPELGRWYAYEVMLRANTPGERDGRIAMWLDGELIADFGNLRLRDVASLRIDRFNLSLHIGSNTVAETRKWYDDVVAATEYIGPIASP